MPEEVFILAFTSIIAGTMMIAIIVSSIFKFLRERHRVQAPSGPSLTTSELEHLMRQAVEEATAPLAAKVAQLERQVKAQERLLPEAAPPSLSLPEDDEATQEPALRRATRSPHR